MSPHRLTTIRRYKISDDVLSNILDRLDPPSLWRACKVRLSLFVAQYWLNTSAPLL